MRARVWILLALLLVGGGVLYVATTKGFPTTHAAVSNFFRDTVALSPEGAERATNFVRKAFHVPAYALLAALVWWVLPPMRRKSLLVLGVVLAIAGTDEALQSLQPERNGNPVDVGVDLLGALLGVWFVRRLSAARARDERARAR